MSKEIVVSGIQPTGKLHIGNYLGALRNWLKLQDEYPGRCYFFIADYHAMNDEALFTKYRDASQELMIDLLALGLDPKKATVFHQKDVPEVAELCWMFDTVTPVSFLERMTQYKDKSSRRATVNAGLFTYPVLQAADIIIYGGTHVPVGEDQLQHVELTRDIARFWNNRFGVTFVEPKPLLTLTPRVMALNFPERKMSKSIAGSTIDLADTLEEIRSKVRKAVTDTTGPKEGMSPGVQNLFTLLDEFAPVKEAQKFHRQYDDHSIKYSELKDAIAEHIAEHFADFRTRRAALMKKPDHVNKVFAAGAKKARTLAQKTMKEVRSKIGF